MSRLKGYGSYEDQTRMIGRRYGELLRSLNVIDGDELNRVVAQQEKTGKNLDTLLIESGLVDEHKLMDTVSSHLGVETIDVKNIQLAPEILKQVPIRFVHRYNILPIERTPFH